MTLVFPQVIYQDQDLLVVAKPAGLLFHPTHEPTRPNLVARLQVWLREQGLDDYLGTHQRLDQDTSGVVLFSRCREVNPALARQFEGREVSKRYHALTVRPRRLPEPEWSVSNHLLRRGNLTVAGPRGQAAYTDFRRLAHNDRVMLVEARPRTGRRHQIRAHLSDCGLPLLGDVLYGGPAGPRTMLHAVSLSLRHPRTGQALDFSAPYPEDFARLVPAD